MDSFIQEAKRSLDNIEALDKRQDHHAAAMALTVMSMAFLLEAEKQQEKNKKLQAYLDL